eukprot:4546784-Pleurochrysis_carterae.AAC.1
MLTRTRSGVEYGASKGARFASVRIGATSRERVGGELAMSCVAAWARSLAIRRASNESLGRVSVTLAGAVAAAAALAR